VGSPGANNKKCRQVSGEFQMTRILATTAALGCALFASGALAHGEKGEAPPQGWSGSVAAGYVAVRGNSDSSTSNFKGEVFYDKDRWHQSALATAIGASQDGDTSSEAYQAQLKSKYDLNPTIYAFGLAEWNKDRFSSYDHQIFEVGGLGWRVFHTDSQELNLEAGVGATQSELQDGTDNNEVVGRLGADYHWHISENAVFSEKVSSTIGSDNTYMESLTELKAGIIGNLALVLGYLVKHNTDVLPGTDKTDTQTSISLEYKF
jgi:putative salt-induced outer membrane protein